MNAVLIGVEVRRLLRDPVTFLVVVVLPVVFYLGFSLSVPLDALAGGDPGAVKASLMVGLACYGSATAASSLAGQAAIDRLQGWGRQLALTPLRDRDYVSVKALVAVVASIVPTVAVFAAGALTGVRLRAVSWIAAALVVVAGSVVWCAFGLAVGLAGRSQSATAAASAGLVVLAFLGDVFVPLTGTLRAVAQWTPLYAHVQLARWPVAHGVPLAGGIQDAPAVLGATALGWAVAFGAIAIRQVARARERG